MAGFVDEAQLHVKAGNGGAGAVSFRREAHVSKGGPDGGDGGRGGDIWLVTSTGASSLLAFKDHPHRRAGDGAHGRGKGSRGADGSDLEVKVPVGTTVRALDGTIVFDLSATGSRALIARGGRGGKGNAKFLSNRRRAPAFAEQAELGEEHWLNLELKLLADVALVGFPNSGKSTLVSAVSAARPKIANYPFTTLEPHLGVVTTGRSGSETDFVIADIPGLIEGAAEGKGLGHQFLRHVERARVLLLLLDLGPEASPPEVQEEILLGELGRYRPELLERPRVVVGSKGDIAEPGSYSTSSGEIPTGLGMSALVSRLVRIVDEARRAELPEPVPGFAASAEEIGPEESEPEETGSQETGSQETGPGDGMKGAEKNTGSESQKAVARPPSPFVHRPLGESPVEVTRSPDGTYVIGGRSALRAVALSDLTNDEALDLVQVRLRKLGVERALVRAGVRDGDQVQVGDLEFVYHPDDIFTSEPPDSARTRNRKGKGKQTKGNQPKGNRPRGNRPKGNGQGGSGSGS
jgi:GTP-binding protein